MAKMSKIEAFRRLGVEKLKTPYSWAARTTDEKAVVLALWADRFCGRSPAHYDYYQGIPPGPDWINRPGNIERRDHLIWAVDHCDGLVSVVLLTAKDPYSSPRETMSAKPDDIVMKITDLDRQTGEFRAVEFSGP
jgi:hypothetical protein